MTERRRLPYMQLWMDEWAADAQLRSATLAAQGAYLRLVIHAWRMDEPGTLKMRHQMSLEQLGRVIGCSTQEANRLIGELLEVGLVTRLDDGTLFLPKVHDQYDAQLNRPVAQYNRRKAAASGKLTDRIRARVLEEANHTCLACGATEALEVDHVIPLVAGGSNHVSNLQCLCKSCNCRKGDRTEDYR